MWRRRRPLPFDLEVWIEGFGPFGPFSFRITPEGVERYPTGRVERKPLVDAVEERDYITVIAELPGVSKDQIDLRATEDALYISAESEERRYREEVKLPAKIDPKSAKASYKAGVLEVKLRKLEKPKGFRIEIE